jgi:hypothetical protein
VKKKNFLSKRFFFIILLNSIKVSETGNQLDVAKGAYAYALKNSPTYWQLIAVHSIEDNYLLQRHKEPFIL